MPSKLRGKAQRPTNLWFCHRDTENSPLRDLTDGLPSPCLREDGRCAWDSQPCDAVRGKIVWDERITGIVVDRDEKTGQGGPETPAQSGEAPTS